MFTPHFRLTPLPFRGVFPLHLGLRDKLFALVLLVLVPLLAFQVYEIYERFKTRTDQELQSSKELAQANGIAFYNYLQNLWATELAMGTALSSDPHPREIKELMTSQLSAHPIVSTFSWLDPTGIVREASSSSVKETSCADREHVQRVLAGEDKVISGVLESRARHVGTVYVARGIRRQSKLLGIMVASVETDRLGRVLKVDRKGDSNVALVDTQGRMVYRSNGPLPSYNDRLLGPQSPAWEVLRTGKPITGINFHALNDRTTHENKENVSRLGAFSPIPEIGWVALATSPVTEVREEAWNAALNEISILLLITAVSLLAADILGTVFLRPLLALRQAALAISQDDLSARVAIAGSDEIAVAGQAFDLMASRIQGLENERVNFLRVATHELRNPLATVKGACSLMRLQVQSGQASPEDITSEVRILSKGVDRLSVLVNEILDAFRLHEGQLPLKHEPVRLVNMINNALDPYRTLDRNHHFCFENTGDDPVVLGDQGRLEDVMTNLIGNAIKYSLDGKKITISLRKADDLAIISVHDEGFGIPKDDLTRVFETFYRGSNLSGRDPEGIGLGLYICQNIVIRHGGRIWVESLEGQGSTFYVELPLYPPPV